MSIISKQKRFWKHKNGLKKCNGCPLGLGSHISNLRFLPGKRLYGVSPCAYHYKVPWWIVVLLIHCIDRCYLLVPRYEAVMCSERSQRAVSSFFQEVGGGSCAATPSRWEVGVLSRGGRWELYYHSVKVGGGSPLSNYKTTRHKSMFQSARFQSVY